MRKPWKVVLPLLVVAVLATAYTWSVCRAPQPVPGTRAYVNDTFGYGLAYPASLQLQADGEERAMFVRDGQPVAEARAVFVAGKAGQTFAEVAEENREQLCQAAGFPCGKAEDIQPFASEDVAGYSFVLPSADGSRTVGPLYAFVLRSSATASSVLVVMPPLDGPGDAAIVRSIAATVTKSDRK